jgi:Tfp pilus assembly protein PilX
MDEPPEGPGHRRTAVLVVLMVVLVVVALTLMTVPR